MANLEDDLIDLIASEALIDKAKLKRDATLADLGLDSVDIVSVVFAVEEKYGIEIQEDAFKEATNLGQLLDILEGLIEKKPAA